MSAGRPIRVLVVEDSAVARELILHILRGDPAIEVVGTAADGRRALAEVARLQPDVVTMDIVMPEMDGLETTRRLMETSPRPIIIVSGTVERKEVTTTFEALKAGAVAAIPRPAGPGSPEYQVAAFELLRVVKAMAEVRVVRRWQRQPTVPPPAAPGETPLLVAIGASTGGPDVLQRILSALPARFPLPLLVVQHMAPGFIGGLAEWLRRSSLLPVALASDGEAARGGHVYIAPDDRHLGIGGDRRLALSGAPPEKGLRPSVDYLFRAVHTACGGRAIAVLLTGMGQDGVQGMKELRDAGAVTIAQDEESSVIFGMPGAARRAGAAMHLLSPAQIAATLRQLAAAASSQTEKESG